MMIGPNILILPLEHPVHVAEEAATLDHLSGGNYVLGVGLGYRDDEFRAIGTPKKGSTRRFVESIEVIRKLWNEETVTHNGEFFRLDGASIGLRPVRAGGPPIWIAAVVDKAVRRAAELGDGWLITFYPTLEALGEQMKIYREALDASGRLVPVEMPICRECHIGPDRRRALEECGDSLRLKYAAYASWGQDRILSEADRFDQPLKEFVRDRFLIGERGFVRDEMQRYREALSVNHFIMRMQWPGLTHRRVLANIENLAAAAAEMT